MRDKKKAVFNILFLLLVFGLTVYGVFRGEDLESMMHSIRQAQWQWLVPGVALVLFFIWSESIIIWYMMKSYGTRLKKRSCFLFSSVGFFFSCITPSASGGQPMQIYYMKKEKIPIPVSTVVLMIVTITYKLVLVVIGIGIIIFGQGFLHRYLEGILPVYYLGLGLNVFCVVFMTVLVFHPVLTKEILKKASICWKAAPDETQRRTAGKAGCIYGYLPGNGSIFKRAYGRDRGCIRNYICSENGLVCSYLVCVSGVWTVRNFFL